MNLSADNVQPGRRIARCGCGAEFEYQWKGKSRSKCPACIERAVAQANLRTRQRRLGQMRLLKQEGLVATARSRRFNEAELDRVAKTGFTEIARAEGVSDQRVQQIVRMALYRIRQHPELQRLWRAWLDAGSPLPTREDMTEKMLEWQMDLARWWSLYEVLEEADCQPEAQEIMAAVVSFQSVFREATTRLAA